MARPSTTARRYAEAIFEIALRDGTVGEWLSQLERLAQVFTDPELLRRMEDPQSSVADRLSALEQIEAGMLPQISNLLGLLVRRRRLESLPDIHRQFRRLHYRREGIVEAAATSAAELDDAEIGALRERLERMTGGKVELELNVDRDLLGGVQVRIGDQLIDGSVRGRLERLRNRLVAGSLTS